MGAPVGPAARAPFGLPVLAAPVPLSRATLDLARCGIEALPEREIKSRIMQSTNEVGVPISEREVTVTHYDDRTVKVEVAWRVPVIVVQGDTVLAMPLSVKWSSTASAAAAVKR